MTSRIAALAVIALIAVGCSSAEPENGATGAAVGQLSATPRDQAMEFAACMRENGVKEFPDPDASGEMTVDGVVNGSSLDPSSPAWEEAISACKDLQPPGFTGRKRDAGQQDAALVFAQCIRDNGVEDFPDPTPDSPLVDTNRIPSSNRPGGMDVLNAAMRKCRDEGKAAMEGR